MAPRPEDDDRDTMKWNPNHSDDRGQKDQGHDQGGRKSTYDHDDKKKPDKDDE